MILNYRTIMEYGNCDFRCRDDIISDLIKSNKYIYIYMTGKFACYSAEYIVNKGIKLKGFLDTEKYYYDNKKIKILDNDYPCFLESQFNDANNYNLLLGCIDYSKLQYLKNKYRCDVIDYLDVYTPHIMDKSFIDLNENIINELYNNLNDDESREVLIAYLQDRLTGDVRNLCKLNHSQKYLYDWDLLKIGIEDIVIDAGAFIGDSIIEIKNKIGNVPQCVFAFEPDINNMSKLIQNFTPTEIYNIHPISLGLYNEDTILSFSCDGNLSSSININGNCSIKVIAIDNYRIFDNVTIIKMDIEGSELMALKGASHLIKTKKPRLAICIYHRNEDIINIYNFLKQFNYKFYLRQHAYSAEETVLYAI